MSYATGTFENGRTGITIHISWQAREMIGHPNVLTFVRVLHDMMEALEAEQAYVSRKGAAVDICIIRSSGWSGHMTIGRRRRAWEKRATV